MNREDTKVERFFTQVNDWAIENDDFLCKKWVAVLITPPLFIVEIWAYFFMFSRFLFGGISFEYEGMKFS